jgi:hypothetical protein
MTDTATRREIKTRLEPSGFERLVIGPAADFRRSWQEQGVLALELAHTVQALSRFQREDVKREREARGIDPAQAAENCRAELARLIVTLTGHDLGGLFNASKVLH